MTAVPRRIGVVDIGGTKMAAGVVDEYGRLHRRREQPTLAEAGFAPAARRLVGMLREAADGGELAGIAVGSTGPIDRDTGVFGRVDTLPGWQGSDLASALRDGLGVTDIVIENDADAAALGEATCGAGNGCARFVYVTVSTGIGGGVVLGGQIYRGAGGVHPEIGHHILEASGPRCSCGAHGCWETLASGPAMAAWARDQKLGDTPDLLTAESICRRGTEPWARPILEREAFYLGVGLANLVTMFAPDVIALGGGVMRSASLLLDGALRAMRESLTLVPASTTKVVLGMLGDDAVLLGAARAFADVRGSGERI